MNAKMDRDSRWHKTRPAERVGCTNSVVSAILPICSEIVFVHPTRELALSRMATIALRRRLNAVNGAIASLAGEHGFLVADLERLFHGHGVVSTEPWFVQVIEPNLAGATAIADHWYELLTSL
jgi:hypothetical protein